MFPESRKAPGSGDDSLDNSTDTDDSGDGEIVWDDNGDWSEE